MFKYVLLVESSQIRKPVYMGIQPADSELETCEDQWIIINDVFCQFKQVIIKTF